MSYYLTLEGLVYYNSKINNAYVAKEEGKGLSTNDFTDELLEKLENIESYGEENVIESIMVNDEPLEVVSKTVNIDLTSYSKSSDVASLLEDYITKEDLDSNLESISNDQIDELFED